MFEIAEALGVNALRHCAARWIYNERDDGGCGTGLGAVRALLEPHRHAPNGA